VTRATADRRRQIATAALLLLLAGIAVMPLRIVIGGSGLAARKVQGIVWDGSIRDLRLGAVPLGDANARLHILPLLLLRAQFSLSRGDAQFAPGLQGSVTRRLGGFSVEGVKATLPISMLVAPLPADKLELQDFSTRFIAGRCAEAGGNVRLTLAGGVPGFDLANGLLGKPRCDRGDLLIPLISQSAMEHIDIRIAGNGSYSATIFIEGDRNDQAVPLGLAGFRPVAGGYRMVRKGRL
jgi:general secretion pathway protein N